MCFDHPSDMIIDEEFLRLEPFPDRSVKRQTMLLQDDPRPINLWGRIIAEGFTRYKAYVENGLPFPVRQIPAHSRQEAISWACAEQLKRDDLNIEMHKYLIGKRYLAERKQADSTSPSGASPVSSCHRPKRSAVQTAVWLGTQHNCNRCTVVRYANYAAAIDYLASKAPVLMASILSGRLDLPQKAVIKLPLLSDQELRKVNDEPEIYLAHVPRGNKQRGRQPRFHIDSDLSLPARSVKQMPDYDPDAQVTGLTLTIPSWISSIKRVLDLAELSAISGEALNSLSLQLHQLILISEKLSSAVKEAHK